MFELVTPHVRFQRSFLEAADEFLAAGEDRYARIPDIREDAFFDGLSYTREELEDPAAFAHYADWLAAQKEPDAPRPEGIVACTELWMVVAGTYVGAIGLRHELTELLLTWGGHIGPPLRTTQGVRHARSRDDAPGGGRPRDRPGARHVRRRQRGVSPHDREERRCLRGHP